MHLFVTHQESVMRTTLDVADDVLAAVKDKARQENSTAGAVLSRLARQALTASAGGNTVTVAGFRPIPPRGFVVTNEHVNKIREIEGI